MNGTPYRGRGFLAVIDLDNKNGKNGEANFNAWCAERGIVIPPTLRVRTASGGSHIYVVTPHAVGIKIDRLQGVDIPVQVVGAGFGSPGRAI